MQYNKINFKQRRLHSNNFYSFGKSSCRVVATPRTLGSLSYPFYQNQVPFCSSSTKALKGTTKVHFRYYSLISAEIITIAMAKLLSSVILNSNLGENLLGQMLFNIFNAPYNCIVNIDNRITFLFNVNGVR